MRISDWSSDVCSSDLHARERPSTSLGTNGNDDMNEMTKLTAADFASDQEVRWCPGCGDYAILKAVQRTMPEIGADPAKTVFVSGIGCSSRFPYYRSEEHTSELQSLMRLTYAVFCLKKK